MFTIYAEFESILVPEDNKQNPDEYFVNKYQKHAACNYNYQLLVCVYDKFSISFISYLVENAVYNFINVMIEGSKYWSDVKKICFNKELATSKKKIEDFQNSTDFCICDNVYVYGKIKDHCHITGK